MLPKTFPPRIMQLADQIQAKTITPESIPVWDVNQVQECLLRRWLDRRPRLAHSA